MNVRACDWCTSNVIRACEPSNYISFQAELPFLFPTIVVNSWFIASFPLLVLKPFHAAVSGSRDWKSTSHPLNCPAQGKSWRLRLGLMQLCKLDLGDLTQRKSFTQISQLTVRKHGLLSLITLHLASGAESGHQHGVGWPENVYVTLILEQIPLHNTFAWECQIA